MSGHSGALSSLISFPACETENNRICNLVLLQARLVEVAALDPRLGCLSAEVRSLGAAPSLKDTFVVVSEHHASTQQRLHNRLEQVDEGTSSPARSINIFWNIFFPKFETEEPLV